MSGKTSRTKGHSFERRIAEEFRELGFLKARTSRQVSRFADDCKIDIVGVFPFAPQCKAMRKYSSPEEVLRIEHKKYQDSLDFSPDSEMIPLLITKSDKKPVMATLPWEDLKGLILFSKNFQDTDDKH